MQLKETHLNSTVDLSGLDVVGSSQKRVSVKDIVKTLQDNYDHYKKARQRLEVLWADYYVSYLTNPESAKAALSTASRHIGQVQTTWRHNLKSPGAYQSVETLVSYFMGAFFPNDYWFNLVPTSPIGDPDFRSIIELNRKYLNLKFEQSKFQSHVEVAVRECCIAGTSALMFPWKDGNSKFKSLSAFEFYLDPESAEPNEANLIRPYSMHIAEALEYVDSNLFNLCPRELVSKATSKEPSWDTNENMLSHIKYMTGVEKETSRTSKFIEVYEFWGDLQLDELILRNVRATWTSNGLLLNIDTNPYVEKPFVVLNYLNLGKNPYGIGAIQPVSSQLFYRDVVTSRSADNVAVSSDSVILYRQDAILDPDDLVVRPGQKIPVTDITGVKAMTFEGNVNLSVQDMALVDSMVDKAIGTGPYIGVDRGRSGDRVTAEEVAAQREAGGKRLSTVYANLNREFLIPTVRRFHYYCRMFEAAAQTVSYGDTYISIKPEAIDYPFEVRAMGANNIAAREYDIRQLLEWMGIVGQNEQLATQVNWTEALLHLTSLMVPSLADKLVSSGMGANEQVNQQPQLPQDQMMAQLQQEAINEGGSPNARQLQAAASAGTLEQQLQARLAQTGGNLNG